MLRLFLFDLDGVLYDARRVLIEVYRRVLGRHGKDVSLQVLAPIALQSPYQVLRRLGVPSSAAYGVFKSEFEHVVRGEGWLFPGVKVGLEKISMSGGLLGVVTSQVRSRARAVLELGGIRDFFGTVVCYENVGPALKKPHPQPVLLAIQRMRVAPGETIYVGDTPDDIECARRAGVLAGAALWGTWDTATIRTADFSWSSFEEFTGWALERLSKGGPRRDR